jgi:hypothetical protein
LNFKNDLNNSTFCLLAPLFGRVLFERKAAGYIQFVVHAAAKVRFLLFFGIK